MKRFIGVLGALLMAVLIGFGMSYTAPHRVMADFSEGELMTLPEEQDIVVWIEYEMSRPYIYLVDPGGRQLEPDEYAKVYEEDGSIYIYLKNAMAGTWTLGYDKLDNEKIAVSVNPWYQEVEAKYITIGDRDDSNRLQLSFMAASPDDMEYSYFLYIIPENGNTISDRILKAQGTAFTNEECEDSIDMTGLPDGKYTVLFEATLGYSGAFTATMVISDAFEISGNIPELDPKDIVITIDSEINEIRIEWDKLVQDRDEWIFALFIGDEKEPSYSRTLKADQTWDVVTPEGVMSGKVRFELTPRKNGAILGMYKRTFDLNDGTSLKLPPEIFTNEQTFTVDFDTNGKDMNVRVLVNNSESVTVLKGKDTFSVELEKMTTNEIVVFTSTESNVFYKYITKITVDTFPPTLTLYAVTQQFKTTLSEITIKGKTEAGCVVALNDKAVLTDGNGNFSAVAKLNPGDNTLTFIAIDSVGNKTVNSIVVTRDNGLGSVNGANSDYAIKKGVKGILEAYGVTKLSNVIIGIIVGVIAVAVALISALVAGKKDKLPGKINKMLVGLFIYIGVLAAGIFVYSMILQRGVTSQITGSNLVNAIDSMSISKLANLIRLKKIYGNTGMACGITAIVTIVLAVIDILVQVILKKKKGA